MTASRPAPTPFLRILVLSSPILLLVGFLVLHSCDPADLPLAVQPKCAVNCLTGMHCPGCGTGRALHLLASGEPLAALRHNLLLLCIGLPLICCGYAYCFLRFGLGRHPRWRRPPPVLAWALVALVIAFTVLRNLPWWPCTLLAPPPHSWERGRDEPGQDGPTADARHDPGPFGDPVAGDPERP